MSCNDLSWYLKDAQVCRMHSGFVLVTYSPLGLSQDGPLGCTQSVHVVKSYQSLPVLMLPLYGVMFSNTDRNSS